MADNQFAGGVTDPRWCFFDGPGEEWSDLSNWKDGVKPRCGDKVDIAPECGNVTGIEDGVWLDTLWDRRPL